MTAPKKRTLLEKIAGSFNALTMCGGWGAFLVTANTLSDWLFALAGAHTLTTDSPLIVLCLLGACCLLILLGAIGTYAIKIYCFWFDKTDPTAISAP